MEKDKDKDIPKFEDTVEIPESVEAAPAFEDTEEEFTSLEPDIDPEERAFGLGLMKIPFAKDLSSYARAFGDEIDDSDFSLEELTARKDRYMRQYAAEAKQAEEKYPGASMAGSLVSGITTVAAAPGGLMLKGGKQIAAQALGIGALEGISDKVDLELKDAVVGSLTSLGATAVGFGIAKGAGKVIKNAAEAAPVKWIAGMGGRSKAALYNHIDTTYKGLDIGRPEALKKFGKDMAKLNLFKRGDTIDDVVVTTVKTKDAVGKDMGKLISETESRMGAHSKISSTRLSQQAKSYLSPVTKTDVPVTNAGRKKAVEVLDDIVERDAKTGNAIPEEWNLNEIWTWKSKIAKMAYKYESSAIGNSTEGTVNQAAAKFLREAERGMDAMVLDTVERALPAEGMAAFKSLKNKYSNLNVLEGVFDTESKKVTEGTLSGLVKKAWGAHKLTYLVGAGVGVSNPIVGGAIAMAGIVQAATKNTPSAIANANVLSKFLRANPSSQIAARLVRAFDSGDSQEFLDAELAVAGAAAQMKQAPLQRNNDSLIKNANAITILLEDKNPELADAFDKALETQDPGQLKSIGEAISEMPEAREFLEEGQGWEGKLVNPADIVQAQNNLENSNMSYSQRLFHKAALKTSGTIPVPEEEEDPYLKWTSNRGQKPVV
jgi:hypothetical protein